MPLPPGSVFACGSDPGHTFHNAVCKLLQKLQNHALSERPSTYFGRLLDSASPRTAFSIRHAVTQHMLRAPIPIDMLVHALFTLDDASSEQAVLVALPEPTRNACFLDLQARLERVGMTFQRGSVIIRSARSEVHLSQAIERIMPESDSPPSPRSWIFGETRLPDKKSSQKQPLLRHSVRLSTAQVTCLQLSKIYWNMRLLDVLDVSGMTIVEFPPTITTHMHCLTVILARKCSLEMLPGNIDLLVHLAELDVSDNKLTSLPTTLRNLKRLRILGLARNDIAVFPSQPLGLPALEVLLLSGNAFAALPWAELAALPLLRQLDVSDNLLRDVPPIIETSGSLRYVDLQHNPAGLSLSGEFKRQRIVLC